MNAYELADELLRDNTQLTVTSACMLRQQADRIAELESCLDFALQDTMDYITLNNLDGENNHWLVWARKLLVNKTPQTKPLSDEEINLLKAEIAAHKKTNELLSKKIIELERHNKK